MRIFRGIVTIKPDKHEAFLEAVNKVVQAARQEEGILEYAGYQSIDDPDTFIFFEVFRDALAYEQHSKQPHAAEFLGCLNDYLAAPPDIKIMDGDWGSME